MLVRKSEPIKILEQQKNDNILVAALGIPNVGEEYLI
jgi:hypothetical protein